MRPSPHRAAARSTSRRGPRERLVAAARRLGRPLRREALLAAIVEGATRFRPGTLCTLRLVQPGVTSLRLVGAATETGPAPSLAVLDADLAGVVRRQARPLVIGDVRLEPPAARRTVWRERGYSLYFGLPLAGPAGPIGVLGLALLAGAPMVTSEERRTVELYAAQAGLALRNLELATTVERQGRTLEVARGELVEAAKVVALGHLVSDVVHEVSNLLGTVTLRMEALLEGPRDPQTEAQLQLLGAHCRQIGDLIGELRRFAGAGGWARAPLDIATSIERIVRLRQPRMLARGVRVVWQRGRGPSEVLADRPALERALLALVLEGEAALAAKPGTLTLRTASVEHDGACWVRAEVEDDGPTIAPHLLHQLFDPFAPRGSGRGPSVGLAAAHAIITAHGGRLTAEVHPTTGMVFRVDLPAAG